MIVKPKIVTLFNADKELFDKIEIPPHLGFPRVIVRNRRVFVQGTPTVPDYYEVYTYWSS